MKNFALFEIPGRIVCPTELNGATKVVIAATYKRRARDGGLEDDPHFNEITVFDAKDRRFIEDRCQKGDLIHVEGECQSSYDRDGKIRDRVNLISPDFRLLAKATALSRTGVGEKGSLCPRLSRLAATAAPPLPAALPAPGRPLKRCNVITTYLTTLHPCTFNVGTVWDSKRSLSWDRA